MHSKWHKHFGRLGKYERLYPFGAKLNTKHYIDCKKTPNLLQYSQRSIWQQDTYACEAAFVYYGKETEQDAMQV